MSNNELKHVDVHMKLWPQTVDKLDELKSYLRVNTKTNAVRYAIDIALMLVKARIDDGDQIILESKTGEKKKILIAGIF
jgi:hypothetical protein